MKRSGERARRLAHRHRRPCWLLEDGFLRSIEPGAVPACSIVVDDEGIYYDARHPSRLERLIATPVSDSQVVRAQRLIAQWRQGMVSKYNHAPDPDMSAIPSPYVLVVDQTAGDASIASGCAGAKSFHEMLEDAWNSHPECYVVVKMHPEVVQGRKAGHFNVDVLRNRPRIYVMADDVHPAALVASAQAVYTVTSQLGFEALLWHKPVHVYGMPFYAGWGLTHDRLTAPDRRETVSLAQLVHACLVDYPQYFDPESGARCDAETVLSWLALQRQQRQRFPSRLVAYGFSRWKRRFVREFLAGSDVTFIDRLPSRNTASAPVVTWGHKHSRELRKHGYADSIVLRIEDGFVRSVGLGAEFTRPLSWVVDPQGIYYDASQPSTLENLLNFAQFDSETIARAARLRDAIVGKGITKYNLPQARRWQRPPDAKHVVLVPGQVETDAAITYGASYLRSNLSLLKTVRQRHPDAWLLYKPHPDVVAGLRDQGTDEGQAHEWCDEILTEIPIQTLLNQVDEVHVLTSLAGFEALLRGIPVTTWGQPFYAGWGLTTDMALAPEVAGRRNRKLSIDELVAATLLMYPTYVSRQTGRYCTAERAVQELLEWRGTPDVNFLRRVIARLARKP